MRRITEESVGCTKFANEESGFEGIIKHRYTDFHVHEIDMQGNVVELTSTDALPEPKLPPGFDKFLKGSQKMFTFKEESEQQIARIYKEHPELFIKRICGQATVERSQKPRPKPQIVKFVMYKENINQQEAVAKLISRLRIEQSKFGFAGNKDKRAITTQYVTIRDVPMERVIQACRALDHVQCGMFSYALQPLNLGDLKGNRFTLAVRNINIGPSELSKKVEAIKKSGFINYYGMQRFGTGETATHQIGLHIIKGDTDKAVDAIMNPVEGEEQRIHEAKIAFQRCEIEKALSLLPHSCVAERNIVLASQNTNKKREMFKAVDRRQRMMYVHAYQSYIFNKCASLRAERGFKVLGDDLVEFKGKVKGPSKNSKLEEVVIPLCGGEKTPKYIVEMMKEDGVTPEMFNKLAKEYGIKQEYRHFIAYAKNIEFSVVKHDNPNEQIIYTDTDRLSDPKKKIIKSTGSKITSAVISFSLGPGEYATMFLRELMKRSTEVYTDQELSFKQEEK